MEKKKLSADEKHKRRIALREEKKLALKQLKEKEEK